MCSLDNDFCILLKYIFIPKSNNLMQTFAFKILTAKSISIFGIVCPKISLSKCVLCCMCSLFFPSRSNSNCGCGSVVQFRAPRHQHSPQNAARERSRVRNLRQAFHSLQVEHTFIHKSVSQKFYYTFVNNKYIVGMENKLFCS